MCPAWYSPGSRTSTTSASSRLMSCVACAALTQGPPEVRRSSGQTKHGAGDDRDTDEQRVGLDELEEGGGFQRDPGRDLKRGLNSA